MKLITQCKGGKKNVYNYSNSTGGKKWTRGRTMFSEGRKYLGNHEYIPVITKTNLDTGEITVASIKEAKRFLTEEGYKEYLEAQFIEMAQRA